MVIGETEMTQNPFMGTFESREGKFPAACSEVINSQSEAPVGE